MSEPISDEEKKREQDMLQNLVDVAFHDGVLAAIEKARALKDPFLLDAFHDLLVDKLHDELVARDKIKQAE